MAKKDKKVECCNDKDCKSSDCCSNGQCCHDNENDDCCDYYDENILALDEMIESLIGSLKTECKSEDLSSEKILNLSKVLKNISSAKKNILKADLLSVELDDCLYDDLENDLIDEEPMEFEEDQIDIEPEKKEIKPTSSSKSKK